ncbi:MAG: LPS assembly lipoprotein LptE [Verrucomicrobiota bacterium]|nr:LPS assembly lipoprotein LptE [Verrucomicrobiota bacterium]
MKKAFFTFLFAALLSGCAGYHLGPATPAYLRDIHSIAVPTFRNGTLVPRIEALVTGTVIKQFQQDGTFRIANADSADAILKGEIVSVSRSPARSVRGNVLATVEFNLGLRVSYTLVGRDGQTIKTSGQASGGTNFFVGSDVSTDERQALPLAAEQLAISLVSQLTEGW